MKQEKQQVHCPQCGSEEIFKHKYSKGLIISILLLGMPIPFLKKTYHCFECNIDFKLNHEELENEKPENIYDP